MRSVRTAWSFQEIDRRAPDFAISLGDYIYVSPANLNQATTQFGYYKQAQSGYRGAVYYVVGNHEGYGDNIVAFRQAMNPAAYFTLHGTVGTSTFKFVIVADDVWTAQEESWLGAALARPTTYTFVCRHHPSYNTDPTNQHIYALIMAAHPTLLIDGHTHTYSRDLGLREVVIGNGGAAPLDGTYFGYATLDVRTDGTALVSSYRESDDSLRDSFSVAR